MRVNTISVYVTNIKCVMENEIIMSVINCEGLSNVYNVEQKKITIYKNQKTINAC